MRLIKIVPRFFLRIALERVEALEAENKALLDHIRLLESNAGRLVTLLESIVDTVEGGKE